MCLRVRLKKKYGKNIFFGILKVTEKTLVFLGPVWLSWIRIMRLALDPDPQHNNWFQ
jgi:hypothetical protein